ncbi:hypothetical protein D3C80_1190000 [compost metagenome]
MHIGDYKKFSEHTFYNIKEKVTIGGKEYFHFDGLVGGDVTWSEFYRLDDQNNLYQAFDSPLALVSEIHIASFNKKKGDVFYSTTSPNSPNNLKILVLEKTDDIMVFQYDYPEYSSIADHTITFRKGLGFEEPYSEVKINNVVYKY